MDKRTSAEKKILQLVSGQGIDSEAQERALNEARANFFGAATPDEEVDLSQMPTDEDVAKAQLAQMENQEHQHQFIPVGIFPVPIPGSKVTGDAPTMMPCIVYACDGCPAQSIAPINSQMINDLQQAVVMSRSSNGSGIVVPS